MSPAAWPPSFPCLTHPCLSTCIWRQNPASFFWHGLLLPPPPLPGITHVRDPLTSGSAVKGSLNAYRYRYVIFEDNGTVCMQLCCVLTYVFNTIRFYIRVPVLLLTIKHDQTWISRLLTRNLLIVTLAGSYPNQCCGSGSVCFLASRIRIH